MNVIVRNLGLVDYMCSLQRMRDFVDARVEGSIDEIWFLQHPPVYTQGQGVNLQQLQHVVKDFLKQHPADPIVVIPHHTVDAARFVEVMDSAKQAGAASVAIAVQKKNPTP